MMGHISAQGDPSAALFGSWERTRTRRFPPSKKYRCNDVLLECNGELVDSGSVKVLRVRKFSLGFEMLEFVCPRCKQRHESLQFR